MFHTRLKNLGRMSLLLLAGISLSAAAEIGVFAISDIASLQIREDGAYNVLCRNNTFEVVASEDIAIGNVCPYVKPAAKLLDGNYVSTRGGLCQMSVKTTLSRGQLTSVRMNFPGCTGEFLEATCQGAVCKGVSYGQNIQVTIIDSTHYHWQNLTITTSEADFSRIGDLMKDVFATPKASVAQPSLRLNPSIAGQPL